MISSRMLHFLLGMGSTHLSAIAMVIVNIISIPIGLQYFGIEKYGALSIVTTLLAYLSLSNLGIPTAASILASKSQDKIEVFVIIMKAFIMTLLICLLAVISIFLLMNDSWWMILLGKIPLNIYKEVQDASVIATLLFLLNIPWTTFMAGFIADGKIYIERLYAAISSSLSLFALLLCIKIEGNLVTYLGIRGIMMILLNIISGIHLILSTQNVKHVLLNSIKKIIKPSIHQTISYNSLFSNGYRIFFLSLSSMVAFNTDNLVISNFIGMEAVASYSITFKLISTSYIIVTALNAALGPMYGNAYAGGDTEWIQGTYNKIATVNSILGGMIWIGAIGFAEEIIHLWVGSAGYAGLLVVFALGGYGYSLSLCHVHASLLSNISIDNKNVLIGWSEAGVNFILSIIMVLVLGAGGVALGTFLAAIATVFWMMPREINRRTHGKIIFDFKPILRHFKKVVAPLLLVSLFVEYAVEQKIFKLILDIIILLAYTIISYKMLPNEIKATSIKVLNKLINTQR